MRAWDSADRMIKEDEVRRALALLPEHSWIRQYVLYAENLTDSHLFYHVAVALTTSQW